MMAFQADTQQQQQGLQELATQNVREMTPEKVITKDTKLSVKKEECQGEETPKFRFFVGNVPVGTTRQEFSDLFSELGADIDFLRDTVDSPFGFVKATSQEVHDILINNEHTLNGEVLSITVAKPKKMKFFLGGVTSNTTDDMVREHFGQFATVTEAFVVKNRGFGFVTLESAAGKQLEEILNLPHTVDNRTIDVKIAQPKGTAPPPRNQSRSFAPYRGASTLLSTRVQPQRIVHVPVPVYMNPMASMGLTMPNLGVPGFAMPTLPSVYMNPAANLMPTSTWPLYGTPRW